MSCSERFWSKVDASGDCWEWTAYRLQGYGRFGIRSNEVVYAHRFAYEELVGPIPAGLVIDHLCRNRACVNPDHMEAVSNRENLIRGVGFPAANVAKTHCPHGHEYSVTNTYVCSRGYRSCRMCAKRRQEVRRAA